jgi:hypothetical protein
MEYLKPIETLEKSVSSYQKIIIALIVLVGVTATVISYLSRESNPVLVQIDSSINLAKVESWKLSAARMEAFTRAYLGSRFEWSETTFDQKKTMLATLTDAGIFSKLKDSVNAFEAIAKNQKAASYYILEGFWFSNTDHKIEARLTRVLRIQEAALATPLIVHLTYIDAPLTPENPYGLKVSALDESEVRGDRGAHE